MNNPKALNDIGYQTKPEYTGKTFAIFEKPGFSPNSMFVLDISDEGVCKQYEFEDCPPIPFFLTKEEINAIYHYYNDKES